MKAIQPIREQESLYKLYNKKQYLNKQHISVFKNYISTFF